MYDRDRLLQRVDLVELADELLGPRTSTQRSGTWPCPSLNHVQTGRTPPLSVFATRTGEQRWRCHGCGAGGSAIDLVMACQHTDVRGALDMLARRTGTADLVPGRGVSTLRPRPHVSPSPSRLEPALAEVLDAYIRECAERLWRPEGNRVREWLVGVRRLPEEVLRANRVGADPGPGRQARPDGVPRVAGAVFPVLEGRTAVFAQLRRLGGADPRWLSVAGRLAPNPKVACYAPPSSACTPLVVTEGPIDALTACAAGFHSAAMLGATVADAATAERLARWPAALVLALDQDDAGRRGADALAAQLSARRRNYTYLPLPAGVVDLNEWAQRDPDWQRRLHNAVTGALGSAAERAPPALA